MNNYRVCTMLLGYKSGPTLEFTAQNHAIADHKALAFARKTQECIGYNLEIKVLSKRAKLGYVWKPCIFHDAA